ncbi:hypothetical protein [Mycobacterium sp. URHB0021]
MLKALRRVPMTETAYLCLLLGFVALGTFVYALAAESALAGIIGVGMVILMVASIVGFRIGARKRAASNDSGIEIPDENIWGRPLRRGQIERYLSTYRGIPDNHGQLLQALPVPGGDATRWIDRRAA